MKRELPEKPGVTERVSSRRGVHQRALPPGFTPPPPRLQRRRNVTADLKRLVAELAGQKRAHVCRLASCLD